MIYTFTFPATVSVSISANSEQRATDQLEEQIRQYLRDDEERFWKHFTMPSLLLASVVQPKLVEKHDPDKNNTTYYG